MNREETLSLYGKGRDSWNRWAENLLAAKDQLAQEGKWLVETHPLRGMPDYLFEHMVGLNDDSSSWIASAAVDFEGHEFADDASFEQFKFPGGSSFAEAKFQKVGNFAGAEFFGDAVFKRGVFSGKAKFNGACFRGSARFNGTKFLQDGSFAEVRFCDDASFDFSEFLQRGWFSSPGTINAPRTIFSKRADFTHSKFVVGSCFSELDFLGPSSFIETDFGRFSYFEGTTFKSNAIFKGSKFSGWINFRNSRFNGDAIFDYANISEGSEFDLQSSEFSFPPSFFGCRIDPPPRVDDMKIRVPRFGLVPHP